MRQSLATDYERSVLPDQVEAHEEWIDKARALARSICLSKGEVSADDIWDQCPPPPNADPRVMGAVFKPRNEWEVVGHRRSRRPINHGRPITVWCLKSMEG